MNANYNDVQDNRRMPDMREDEIQGRMMGKESDQYMARSNGNRTMSNAKDVEQIYLQIDERMAKGLSFHEQLADYFCFLGLQGFKRMLEYQYMNECADKRKLHRRYIDMHHKILPVQQVRMPVFIPQSWSNYTTESIDDNVIPKFVKSALSEWKTWEEETKKEYEEAWQRLKDVGLVTDAEQIKDMIKDVEKELKDIHRISETLNGTGYDVNMIHSIQEKYHDKYKSKYNEKYKKNKTKDHMIEGYDRKRKMGYLS